jgi:hypothetical protein
MALMVVDTFALSAVLLPFRRFGTGAKGNMGRCGMRPGAVR